MRLRKEFDIPEEYVSEEDLERDRREQEARAKRLEVAETEENYVKMFNRDPWTDEWLGPGPEPPMPFLEDDLSKKEQKEAIKERKEREHREFIDKFQLYTKLPVREMKAPKETKKIKKERKKLKKKHKKLEYQIANDLIQNYFTEEYKDKMFAECNYDVELIVAECLDFYEGLKWLNHVSEIQKKDHRTQKEMFDAVYDRIEDRNNGVVEKDGIRWAPVDVAYADKKEIDTDPRNGYVDIPDELWDEFSEWADKHPMKKYKKKAREWNTDVINARRIMFAKKVNKRNKNFRKNMVMTDPLTGMAFVSEKKFKKYKDEQIKRFAKQRKEYAAYVKEMVDKGYISEDYMVTFLGDDEEAIKRVKKRYKEVEERAKAHSKKMKEEEEHKKKRDKERIDWFRKYGYEVEDTDKPFEIVADGETLTIRPCKSGKRKIWALDQKGSTKYAEHIEDFMS